MPCRPHQAVSWPPSYILYRCSHPAAVCACPHSTPTHCFNNPAWMPPPFPTPLHCVSMCPSHIAVLHTTQPQPYPDGLMPCHATLHCILGWVQNTEARGEKESLQSPAALAARVIGGITARPKPRSLNLTPSRLHPRPFPHTPATSWTALS